MTVYTYIVTEVKTGKIFSILSAAFDSETKATDVLYEHFQDDYRIVWNGKYYEMRQRTIKGKHTLNAYIVDFVVIN